MNANRTNRTTATRKAKPRPATKRRGGFAVASAAMGEAARQVEIPAPPTAPARGRSGARVEPKKPKPKTREGKKGLVLYVHPDVSLALRKLALETDSDVQQLGRRALALLFAEYGRTLPDAAVDRSSGA